MTQFHSTNVMLIVACKRPQTDNQRAGNTLSHMQALGYRVNYSNAYVITVCNAQEFLSPHSEVQTAKDI